MDKEAVINQLKSLRDNSESAYDLAMEHGGTDIDSIHKEDIEALNTAISILTKEQSRKFNRTLIDKMLDEIGQDYSKDGNPFSIWEVIENVKDKYENEIEILASQEDIWEI